MVPSGMLRRVALVRTDLRSVRRLLVTASVVPSSPILFTLIKEALSSSETSVLIRTTQRNIIEYTILGKGSLSVRELCVSELVSCLRDLFGLQGVVVAQARMYRGHTC
jgi:hypothetical protein